MIDTVTFDFWNTLISNTADDALRFKKLRIEGIVEAFLAKGLKVKEEEVERALDITFKRCWDLWGRNVDCSSREQIKTLMDFLPDLDQAPAPDLLKRVEEAYTESVLKSPSDPVEGSLAILKYLKIERYKLGLICNTGRSPGKILRRLMEHYQILKYFDFLTFSDELKIRKPDPRIFLFTLKSLKSTPSNSIHIGDELQTDVKGAKDAGMIAVHFTKIYPHHQEIEPDYNIRELEEIKNIVEELKDA